jgi:hypothetical protein
MGLGVNPAIFPKLDPAAYVRHALHGGDRIWTESNCYCDLWVEVLHAMGLAPEAAFGFAVTQDFEGDQFTFAKPPLEDLEALFGVVVQELAIFDDVAAHVEAQLGRGRLSLVEVDSFFLPDTRGLSYQTSHGKTSIAINRLDRTARRVEYFHGSGYHLLEGADYDGVFKGYGDGVTPFLPYVEFIKLPQSVSPVDRSLAAEILARHLQRRPKVNPLRVFQSEIAELAAEVASREAGYFHLFAFNTLRQFGANFELLASHVAWLEGRPDAPGVAAATQIAETAKASQFQLARACARKKFDALPLALEPAVNAYDELMTSLVAQWGASSSRD